MTTFQWPPEEPYMSQRQLEYFRERLENWRQELMHASRQTIDHMRDQQPEIGDEADESVRLESQQFELRTRDRYRKLIRKIDLALDRIRDGSYHRRADWPRAPRGQAHRQSLPGCPGNQGTQRAECGDIPRPSRDGVLARVLWRREN